MNKLDKYKGCTVTHANPKLGTGKIIKLEEEYVTINFSTANVESHICEFPFPKSFFGEHPKLFTKDSSLKQYLEIYMQDFLCEFCGEYTSNSRNSDDILLCDKCKSKICKCYGCNDYFDKSECTSPDGYTWFCQNCYHDYFYECPICHNTFLSYEMVSSPYVENNTLFCKRCFASHFLTCDACHIRIDREHAKTKNHHRYYCPDCMSDIENYGNPRTRSDRLENDYINKSEILIFIKYLNNQQEKYIVTTSTNNFNANSGKLLYTDPDALELLSAALHPSRYGRGILHDQHFRIINVRYNESLHNILIPLKLLISQSGGYYSSALKPNQSYVDILLYSKYTRRYELLKATYDKDKNKCYVSNQRFKQFELDYGPIDIERGPLIDHRLTSKNWNGLNDESILRMYGYTVSQEWGLTADERHSILEYVVDADIMSIPRIVRHLTWLSSTNGQRNLEAREKWQEDILFISNYKMHTEQCFIPEVLKKNRF